MTDKTKTEAKPPRAINREGLDIIKHYEGLRLRAYLCPAGVWTIGYGHTAAAGAPAPSKGMAIDKAQAEALLRRDLQAYEAAVERAVRPPLSDNQFSALVSLCYNIGAGAFKKSRIPALINKGQCDTVPAEIMRYVYAGGKKQGGLVSRRAAEAALWSQGDAAPNSALSASASVPAEAGCRPCLCAPEVIAPIAGAAAGLTGFADGSGPFQWALAAVMVLCALLAAFYFIRRVKRGEF